MVEDLSPEAKVRMKLKQSDVDINENRGNSRENLDEVNTQLKDAEEYLRSTVPSMLAETVHIELVRYYSLRTVTNCPFHTNTISNKRSLEDLPFD
ncbi:hypothetical protein CEXT_486261 [Caerostris extrusa]|uniref:Uncharacterized protein n=1 Tax=Caerostris extrusa TaxID=172846 RepID=A0AAV4N5K9_CAEEX|nr:hypothetical protein CEXT_486261 [Caerostris extrusa]